MTSLVMNDLAAEFRGWIVASTPKVSVTHPTMSDEDLRAVRLEQKRAAAKAYLGAAYVLHPAYRFNRRHSNDPAVFKTVPGLLDAIYLSAITAGRI